MYFIVYVRKVYCLKFSVCFTYIIRIQQISRFDMELDTDSTSDVLMLKDGSNSRYYIMNILCNVYHIHSKLPFTDPGIIVLL